MRKKELLAKACSAAYLVPAMAYLRQLLTSEVIILAYHRIKDIDATTYPFDADLVSAGCADFHWQVHYLKAHYNVITFATLIEHLAHGAPLPPRSVIITFDDGFDDNYHNAFPILKVAQVPATIFLSTGYISSDEPYWFDWLVYVLRKHTGMRTSDVAGLPGLAGGDLPLDTGMLLRLMKRVPNHTRLSLLDAIAEASGEPRNQGGQSDCRAMTWEQVREMADAGIEFGSHTVTHPILSRLGDDALWQEIHDSKQQIEQKLDKPCQVIAYPVGGREEYDTRVIELSQKAGYSLGASYEVGSNPLGRLEPFALKRLHVETDVSRERFAAMLTSSRLFG